VSLAPGTRLGVYEITSQIGDVDGRRFLMIKDAVLSQSSAPTILVIQNWTEELKRLVPSR
jgi:hypothetical protein